MMFFAPVIKVINPSTIENVVDGVDKPLTTSSYSIKIANATIALALTLTYRHGEIITLNFSENTIINIENLNLKSLMFVDTNSYDIYISQHIVEFDSKEEYELMKNGYAPKIYFVA